MTNNGKRIQEQNVGKRNTNIGSHSKMTDKEKIPEPLYSELIDLLGYEEAEKFLVKEQYDFHTISNKIITEKLKKRFGRKFWIYFWIILILLAAMYEILSYNLII